MNLIPKDRKSLFRLIINIVFISLIAFIWYKDISTHIDKHEIEDRRLEQLYKSQDSILVESGKTINLLKYQQEEMIKVQEGLDKKLAILSKTKQNIIIDNEEENIIISNATYDELGQRLCAAIIIAVNAEVRISDNSE